MPDTGFSLDELTDAYSEPFGCQSAQAMMWVSRVVGSSATVLLTGDGGDDVFLGYPFLKNAWMAQRLARLLPPGSATAWRSVRTTLPANGAARRARNFLEYTAGGLGAYIRAHNGLPYFEERSMLGDRLAGLRLPLREIPASAESARNLLSEVLRYHREVHFTSEFMPKLDGGTMYYGLEARAPFLDQKLWEFAAALPPQIRFHGGMLKAVLREIVRRRIGPEVANRRKQGFTVPGEKWLAGKWSNVLNRLEGETVLEREGWVRSGVLSAPVKHAVANQWIPSQLWHLLVLEYWLEKDSFAPRGNRQAGVVCT